MTYLNEAIEKLNKEKEDIKDRMQKVVCEETIKALTDFCKQNEEFAQAIVQSDKPLTKALAEALKGVNSGISDIDLYKKVVSAYFPTATIEMKMKINTCGKVEEQTAKVINLSFDDLF